MKTKQLFALIDALKAAEAQVEELRDLELVNTLLRAEILVVRSQRDRLQEALEDIGLPNILGVSVGRLEAYRSAILQVDIPF